MHRNIVIEPVTRIEGHAKITVQLDQNGFVSDARFHVTQFRGFEKFCEGRPFSEMPSLTARTCGICPVSHFIASAKACDQILAVEIPPAAVALRKIVNLAQLVQSHALSFFYLSAPDLLFGMDAPPATRNIFGVIEKHPELANDGIALRKFGQQVIEILAGKRIHPAWIVPGGVASPLSSENRDRLIALIPEAMAIARRSLDWFKSIAGKFHEEIEHFGNFPSMFMGLVGASPGNSSERCLDHYSGQLLFIDCQGTVLADIDPSQYEAWIGEAVENDSFLKSPYFRPAGYPTGLYRVGPLARLNLVSRCGEPRSDEELAEFRAGQTSPVLSSFHQHRARLIEILYAIERIASLLSQPEVLEKRVRAHAQPNRLEGIGVSEAPRGTLIHHYKVDEQGAIRWSNLIIATGHNSLALNRSVRQVALRYVKGDRIQQGMLNRVEAVIRAFDPCLSCSTHAAGRIPLQITLLGPKGEILDELAP